VGNRIELYGHITDHPELRITPAGTPLLRFVVDFGERVQALLMPVVMVGGEANACDRIGGWQPDPADWRRAQSRTARSYRRSRSRSRRSQNQARATKRLELVLVPALRAAASLAFNQNWQTPG